MSSRKRPLAEISQARGTPSRYAPSTPHALRALQLQLQRSGNRTRPQSARSERSAVRPDSARGILRRLAKVTAPTTKRRVVTPVVRKYSIDKENVPPEEDDDDERELEKPSLKFPIEDSIEEEDSEIPAAPTPSVLPDDDDEDFNEDDQPTETFQNLKTLHRVDRRVSTLPPQILMSEPDMRDAEDEDLNENEESTILSERGRRAVSEEGTGRLSRYSFGSIRFSDFGSELEIRRNSDLLAQAPDMDLTVDKSNMFQGDDEPLDLGQETEDLRNFPHSMLADMPADESLQIPNIGDETFELDVQEISQGAALEQTQRRQTLANSESRSFLNSSDVRDQGAEPSNKASPRLNRRRTLLENAIAAARSKPRKRLKMTRHGNIIPSLPSSLMKRIIQQSADLAGKRRPVLGKDHIKALEQASEWFFEQLGDDLATYSSHGKRKKRINSEDVLLLMRRQRMVSGDGELAQLARDWLPKEMVRELDLPDQL